MLISDSNKETKGIICSSIDEETQFTLMSIARSRSRSSIAIKKIKRSATGSGPRYEPTGLGRLVAPACDSTRYRDLG